MDDEGIGIVDETERADNKETSKNNNIEKGRNTSACANFENVAGVSDFIKLLKIIRLLGAPVMPFFFTCSDNVLFII